MAKIRDIASYLNVSVSTVSKALNGSPEISKPTVERVVRAARELKYFSERVDPFDLGKSSNIIGVIVPEAISSYYSVLTHNIGTLLESRGLSMIAGFSNLSPKEEIKLLHMMAGLKVDGVILFRSFEENMTGELERFKETSNIPVIQIVLQLCDGFIAQSYDGYAIDENHGIYQALKYLKDIGHRKIAFLGEKNTSQRNKFFIENMKKLELPLDETLVLNSEERFELCGYLLMQKVLAGKNLPTAVMAAYDDVAIGAMRAITEAGFVIPDDISVVGFDGIQSAHYLQTSLTTVSVPFTKLAQIAADALCERMTSGDQTNALHAKIMPELFIRESTATPLDEKK